MAKEACVGCGEETGVGSAYFSDRQVIDRTNKPRTFVCPLCNPRIRLGRRGRRLTEEEVRNLTKNGSMAGLTWGGGMGGVGPGG